MTVEAFKIAETYKGVRSKDADTGAGPIPEAVRATEAAIMSITTEYHHAAAGLPIMPTTPDYDNIQL